MKVVVRGMRGKEVITTWDAEVVGLEVVVDATTMMGNVLPNKCILFKSRWYTDEMGKQKSSSSRAKVWKGMNQESTSGLRGFKQLHGVRC